MSEYKTMCPKCETEMEKLDLGGFSELPMANGQSTIAIADELYKCSTCGRVRGFPRSLIA